MISLVGQAMTLTGLLISVFVLSRSIRKDRETKLVSDALLAQKVTDLKEKFDKETGGNSGGMREAINTIRDTQIKEVEKAEAIATIVHRLEGQFSEMRR